MLSVLWIVIIVVVVLAIAIVATILLLKKKKTNPPSSTLRPTTKNPSTTLSPAPFTSIPPTSLIPYVKFTGYLAVYQPDADISGFFKQGDHYEVSTETIGPQGQAYNPSLISLIRYGSGENAQFFIDYGRMYAPSPSQIIDENLTLVDFVDAKSQNYFQVLPHGQTDFILTLADNGLFLQAVGNGLKTTASQTTWRFFQGIDFLFRILSNPYPTDFLLTAV